MKVKVVSVCAMFFVAHSALLAFSGYFHSPTYDEVGHLAAGVSQYHFRSYFVYKVNPPLVKYVAALPVILQRPQVDWKHADDRPAYLADWLIGKDFVAANGDRAFWYFTFARWACIPFGLLGGYICFRWAGELYGEWSGLLALGLWCFCPNILAHGSLITPDVPASALGVASCYTLWKWLQQPSWLNTLFAGLMLGLAELTKMTWIILFALWPLLWLVHIFSSRPPVRISSQASRMALILLIALLVLNLGYGFEGTFRPLGEYKFVSEAFSGVRSKEPGDIHIGNRFTGTWLGNLPVPLPKNYLTGLDFQKREFEIGRWVYLGGYFRHGDGWWYFYIYALAVKLPLGTLALLVLALVVSLLAPRYLAHWRDEMLLVVPMVSVFVLISWNCQVSYLRYALPLFPFGFIWVSKLARSFLWRDWKVAGPTALFFLCSVLSSLFVYPHSLSYFNELAGGPAGGHYHLTDSNIDWGQDMFSLKKWHNENPQARPLYVDCFGILDPQTYGIEGQKVPFRFEAGWYALSVNQLHDPLHKYDGFLRLRPVAMAGYSIYIYRISEQEAERIRGHARD